MIERAGSPSPGGAVALQRIEAGERPDAAVDADRVDPGGGQRGDRGLGRRPVGQRDVVAERHRRDHRDVGRAMGLVDGEQQVREVEEGLEHQQVGAALEQPVDLLAEGGPDRRLVGMAELARRRARAARCCRRPTRRGR